MYVLARNLYFFFLYYNYIEFYIRVRIKWVRERVCAAIATYFTNEVLVVIQVDSAVFSC